MYIYNFIFGFNFILAFLNLGLKKRSNIILIFSFIILNIFMCFNYTNGIDWTQYQKNYIEIYTFDRIFESNYGLNIPERNLGEFAFYYLMSICKTLGINYEFFQYICLSIVMLIIYKMISSTTKYGAISILIYYSYFMLGTFFEPIFRQLLAIAFFYLAIPDIENKNILKYYFKIFLAILFHSSSLICIPLYFILNKKLKILGIIFLVIGSSFMGSFFYQILLFFSSIFKVISKYLLYFQIEEFGMRNEINIIYVIKVFLVIVIGVFIEKNQNKLEISKSKFYLILNLYWINLLTFSLRRQMVIMERFQYFFEIFYVIMIAFLFEIIVKKHGRKIGFILLLVFSFLFYRIMFIQIDYWIKRDKGRYLPYDNYIQKLIFDKNFKRKSEKISHRLNNMEGIKK